MHIDRLKYDLAKHVSRKQIVQKHINIYGKKNIYTYFPIKKKDDIHSFRERI